MTELRLIAMVLRDCSSFKELISPYFTLIYSLSISFSLVAAPSRQITSRLG